MNVAAQIRGLVAQYADPENPLPLKEFRERFVVLYRDAVRSDEKTATLAKKVEVLYGELVEDNIDEKTFMKQALAIPAEIDNRELPMGVQQPVQVFQFTSTGGATTNPRSSGTLSSLPRLCAAALH